MAEFFHKKNIVMTDRLLVFYNVKKPYKTSISLNLICTEY